MLNKKELCDLHSPSSFIRMVKSWRDRQTCNLDRRKTKL